MNPPRGLPPKIAYFYRNESYGATPGLAFSVFNAMGFTQAGADFELLLGKTGSGDPATIPARVFGLDAPIRIRGLPAGRIGKSHILLYLAAWLYLMRSDRTVLIFRNTNFLPFAALLKRLRRMTVCYEAHDCWSEPDLRTAGGRKGRPRYTRLERRWIPTMDRVICVSAPQGDLYERLYPNVPVTRAVTGCPPAAPNRRTAFSRTLGYIGSFSPAKYPLPVVMQAMAQCRTPDVRLLCIGARTDEHRAFVADAARAAGVDGRVEARPWLTGPQLDAAKREMDVGVAVLSGEYLNRIASPLKVLDYLSAGLPFIATALDGIARLVEHEKHGMLVDNTPAAWADAMDVLYADFGRYRRMADACHTLALECGWDRRARRILDAL